MPYEKLKTIIKNSRNLCVFTGAGISCPSGIPDFRSADGLYHRETNFTFPPEQIISHSFFLQHTDMFYEFYKSAMLYPDAKPNAAHLYFAKLEADGKNVTVVTQNIDGLHQAAGSKNVLELHGSVHRNYCTRCGRFHDVQFVKNSVGVPLCECGGVVKPDVVLYGESLDGPTLEKAVEALGSADLLLIGGTSLAVYPAAGLIQYFGGDRLVLLNRDVTPYDRRASLCIREPIGRVLGQIQVR